MSVRDFSFSASPRSRNAHGHFTSQEPFCAEFTGNWPDTDDTTTTEHRALTLTIRTPVWPHCLGKNKKNWPDPTRRTWREFVEDLWLVMIWCNSLNPKHVFFTFHLNPGESARRNRTDGVWFNVVFLTKDERHLQQFKVQTSTRRSCSTIKALFASHGLGVHCTSRGFKES